MASNDITEPLLQSQDSDPNQLQTRPSECRLADKSCFLNDGSNIPGRDQKQVKRKLVIACVLCFLFMLLEVVGGWLANSVAIMSDAAHMFSDMSAFAVSLFAAWVVSRKSHESYSFGYHRAEIVGALVSMSIIWLVTGALVYEAILRTFNPVPVDGKVMFQVAVAALLFNLALMLVVGEHVHHGGGCSHSHSASDGDHGHQHGHGHSCGGHGHSHSHSHSHSHAPQQEQTVSFSPAVKMRTRSGISTSLLSGPAAPANLHQIVVEEEHEGHHRCDDHDHHAHGHSSHSPHTHAGGTCHDHRDEHDHAHDHTHAHDHSHSCDHAHEDKQDGKKEAVPVSHSHDHGSCGGHHHSADDHASSSSDDSSHSHDSHKHDCCHHDHDHHHKHGEASGSPASRQLPSDRLPEGYQCAVITLDGTGSAATNQPAKQRSEQKVLSASEAAPAVAHGGNFGLRSATVHILGDMIQSIGVALAGALIWWNEGDPRWYYADPICTYLFSIMVLLTTRAVMKEAIDILMERTPDHCNLKEVSEKMGEMKGIHDVHDLHIWNLSMGLPILTAHVHISSNACPEDVLKSLEGYMDELGIEHSTIQICNMPPPAITSETQP